MDEMFWAWWVFGFIMEGAVILFGGLAVMEFSEKGERSLEKLMGWSFRGRQLGARQNRLGSVVLDAVRGLRANGVQSRVSYEQLEVLVDAAGTAFTGLKDALGDVKVSAREGYQRYDVDAWVGELRDVVSKQRRVSPKRVKPEFVKFFVEAVEEVAALDADARVLFAEAAGDSDVKSAVSHSLKGRCGDFTAGLEKTNRSLTNTISRNILNVGDRKAVTGGTDGSIMLAMAKRKNGELNPFVDSVEPRDPGRKVVRF